MHQAPFPDSAGDFTDFVECDTSCRECGASPVGVRKWESHCGGYEDYNFKCPACGHSWWVDGVDS